MDAGRFDPDLLTFGEERPVFLSPHSLIFYLVKPLEDLSFLYLKYLVLCLMSCVLCLSSKFLASNFSYLISRI